MEMFCYQCEQAAKGTGCDAFGICGKNPEVAALQDLLLATAQGISRLAVAAEGDGADPEAARFVIEALFTTVTNVDFDPDRLDAMIDRGAALLAVGRDRAPAPAAADAYALLEPAPDRAGRVVQAAEFGVAKRHAAFGDDVAGLIDLLVYGLKGSAAYADHAWILGRVDERINADFLRLLAAGADPAPTAEGLLSACLQTGELNLRVMELLDAANTGAYGHPEPTAVNTGAIAGKCILVSGHDLLDLDELLKQTAGTGVNVYTHGEMLPCHAYPELKKHPHLAGNWGGAWQDQAKDFAAFPGAILMTTNCIQKPRESYDERIFTCGLVGWPGVPHIADRNFAPVIAAAQAAEGFAQDGPRREITVGFGHNAVLGVADKVIEAVKGGAIRHFFLIGGCDGAKPGRSYYTDLAASVPDDCVVMTLACGKFRFNKLEFGEIGGLPRLLDVGQCNDAYSAVRIAAALAEAFDCGVNDLPLSLVLSWYEQKAVAILLTLLHLGIKGIRIGPTLPAFLSPAVVDILVENYDLKPITTAERDLRDMLGGETA